MYFTVITATASAETTTQADAPPPVVPIGKHRNHIVIDRIVNINHVSTVVSISIPQC